LTCNASLSKEITIKLSAAHLQLGTVLANLTICTVQPGSGLNTVGAAPNRMFRDACKTKAKRLEGDPIRAMGART
jgi:hypothetical protein